MAPPDPNRRHLIAAEYVLGTLRGAARRRFEQLRDEDASYCKEADDWQAKLNLMAEAIPGIEPPPSLWRRIERGIADSSPVKIVWRSAAFWRGFSVVAGAVAAALLILFVQSRPPQLPSMPSQVAVLNDKDAKPAWVVRSDFTGHRIAVETLRPQQQPAGTSFELWMIPSTTGQPPMSLGLLSAQGDIRITLSDPQFAVLRGAAALAVSLEPAGGSQTGLPTGPVLYQGTLVPAAS
jgi:anti-sigma-K factor RskA